jgi:hypothetical protein
MFYLHTTGQLMRPFLRTPEDDVKEVNPDKAFVKIIDNSFTTGSQANETSQPCYQPNSLNVFFNLNKHQYRRVG